MVALSVHNERCRSLRSLRIVTMSDDCCLHLQTRPKPRDNDRSCRLIWKRDACTRSNYFRDTKLEIVRVVVWRRRQRRRGARSWRRWRRWRRQRWWRRATLPVAVFVRDMAVGIRARVTPVSTGSRMQVPPLPGAATAGLGASRPGFPVAGAVHRAMVSVAACVRVEVVVVRARVAAVIGVLPDDVPVGHLSATARLGASRPATKVALAVHRAIVSVAAGCVRLTVAVRTLSTPVFSVSIHDERPCLLAATACV